MSNGIDPSIAQLGDFRVFVQEDGVSPGNEYYYHGSVEFGGIGEGQGDLTPIYAPSPDQRNRWVIVGYTRAVKSLPTTDLTARMLRDLQQVWWDLQERGCAVNIHVLIGRCEAPDDFMDWQAKIILSEAVMTDFNLPNMNPLSGENNAAGDITGSLTALSLNRFVPINFQEFANTELVAEAVDGFYASNVSCGDCGMNDDGCDTFLALQVSNAGSPGNSAQIVYTKKVSGGTWAVRDITTLGGKSANKMAKMGRSVVVISEADNAHHTITLANLYANNTSAWKRVTGYATSPLAIYPISSNRAIIVGESGYLWRLNTPGQSPSVISDGSITSQNLRAVDGKSNVVVAGGDTGAVVVSINKGKSFSLKAIIDQDGNTVTGNVTAVGVIDSQKWMLGVAGALYYTEDQGETYTLHPDWPATVSVINDIKFPQKQLGYIAAENSGAGVVYRSDTMGNIWSAEDPYIDGLPSATRYNFVAPCGWNEVAAGGIKSGNDGVLAIAQ